MVNFSLEGKVALVTGASYGIGFALATAFARQGAKIVFNDIKQELVDKGLAAYKAEGIEAKGYVCDVTSEEQVNAMVAQIEKEVGIVDILVNNAGIIRRIRRVVQLVGKILGGILCILHTVGHFINGLFIFGKLPLHIVQGRFRIIELNLPALCPPVIFAKGGGRIFKGRPQGFNLLLLRFNFFIQNSIPRRKSLHRFILLIELRGHQLHFRA